MAKRPSLSSSFTLVEQPILDPTPTPTPKATPTPTLTPKKSPRDDRQAFTVWLEKDLVADLRQLSRALCEERGRAGNTIEALVTHCIQDLLMKHRIDRK